MKKFGITKVNGNDILFFAVGGSFASEAWMESDEAFHNTAGSSFSAITADDGKQYNIGRDVRRVTPEEYSILIKKACPAFKIRIEVENMELRPHMNPSLYMDYLHSLECIPYFVEKGYNENEIIEYFSVKYGNKGE